MHMLDTIGWRTTGLRNRISDRAWEKRLGIQTTGSQEVDAPDSNRYATFAYASIFKIIRFLDLKSNDVFVDIGCGKGRVICCAAMQPARKVIGIDIDKSLCDAARANAIQLQGRKSPIEVVNTGAQAFDYRDCTAFFLFNSFGAATVQAMLDAIEDSLRINPRAIRFAYVNPFHDQLLRDSSFLELQARWQRRPWSGLKFDVSFWRSPNRGA